jgi:hypothetical protein
VGAGLLGLVAVYVEYLSKIKWGNNYISTNSFSKTSQSLKQTIFFMAELVLKASIIFMDRQNNKHALSLTIF